MSQDITATLHTLVAFSFSTRKSSEQSLNFVTSFFIHFTFICQCDEEPGSSDKSLWGHSGKVPLVRKVTTYSFNRLHIHVSTVHFIPILISLRPFGEWSCQVPFRNPRRLYQLYVPYQHACSFLQRTPTDLWGINSLYKTVKNLAQCIIYSCISNNSAILLMSNTSL